MKRKKRNTLLCNFVVQQSVHMKRQKSRQAGLKVKATPNPTGPDQ